MKKIFLFINFAVLLILSLAAKSENDLPSALKQQKAKNTIVFGENSGQVRDQYNNSRADVLFGGSANGLNFYLCNNGISYQLSRIDEWKSIMPTDSKLTKKSNLIPNKTTIYRVDVNWVNHNSNFSVKKGNNLLSPTYFYNQNGNFTSNSFADITFENIYKGIDIKWYEKNGELEYDYICAAGADYKKIKLRVSGAQNLSINKNQELIIETPLGTIIEKAPIVFQNDKQLTASWIINEDIVSIDIPQLNINLPYRIDPVVRIWGTYYGGNGIEEGLFAATDGTANVYMGGYTDLASGTVIATSGAFQTTLSGGIWIDAFIVKFNSAGVRQWGTYYGGNDLDNPRALAVDASGNVFLNGFTSSTVGMSTPGVHQPSLAMTGTIITFDGFVAKFNSSGARLWSTYYGDVGTDDGYGCAVDANGDVYLCGATDVGTGTVIATSGSHQSTIGGGGLDAYLVKFSGSNGTRIWGTFYGGTSSEGASQLATDASGNVYMTGVSSSTNAISSAGHQNVFGGFIDAYLVKFNSNGVRQWATYYGGSGWDEGRAVSVDASGNVYLGGLTDCTVSAVITTSGAQQTIQNGSDDGYLVKFNSNGVRQWGTYYGGESGDAVVNCAIDQTGNIFITGSTSSTLTGAIATPGDYQSNLIGTTNAYLAKFNNSGIRQWGTYYGTTSETGSQCAIDNIGHIYLAGTATSATAIATAGAHQPNNGGGLSDAFLAKFNECGAANQPSNTTPPANQAICTNTTTLFATAGTSTVNWYATATSTTALGTGTAFVTPTLSVGTYTFYAEGLSCAVSASRTAITLTVLAQPTIAVTNYSICSGQTLVIVPTGALSYSINGGSFVVSPTTNSSFTITGSSGACLASNTVVSNVSVVSSPTLTVNSGSICPGQTFTITPGGATNYTIQGGSFTVSPGSTSVYTVMGSNAGCLSQNPATATVELVPTPTISVSDGTICSGQSFTITATGVSSFTVEGGTPVVSPVTNTSYTVIGSNALGCVAQNIATVNITTLQTPTVTINSGSICVGTSFTLNPQGASTYSYSSGSAIVSPSVSTIYTISGSNANNCVNTVTTEIFVILPQTVSFAKDSIILCNNQSSTLNILGASPPYTLSTFDYFQNGVTLTSVTLNSNSFVVNYDNSIHTKKFRIISGNSFCGAASKDSLLVQSAPFISLGEDFPVSKRDGYFKSQAKSYSLTSTPNRPSANFLPPVLKIEPVGSLSGTISTEAETDYCKFAEDKAPGSTIYTITTYYHPQCASTRTLEIRVESSVFVPNVFSPNGDGKNDNLVVFLTNTQLLQFKVYNRLGEVVAEYQDSSNSFSWDGFYKGKLQETGNYTWLMSTFNGFEAQKRTGNVYLKY